MYAVIESGGKQYRVQAGDIINVEKLDVTPGDTIEFDKVLVLSDGKAISIGTPIVENAKVYGNILENGKAEKVIIFKYKSKKDYRKKKGHRQPYTMVRILAISGDGKEVDVAALEAGFKAAAEAKAAEKKARSIKPVAKVVEKAVVEKKTVKTAVDKKAAKPAVKAAAKPAVKKAAKPAVKKTTK